ncbi:response regulator transcription factor [Billgrantia gudaonensis]|uniref:Response regulator transcription factor n=1 Tax=Billgrantia gudaonensis TaxID=376427 RepID=A0A3S0R4T3_9GAMM|nr:response regulator transcription factor [Halomonas gudaonensis]
MRARPRSAPTITCKAVLLVEVAARAKALVRRARQAGNESLKCGALELRPDSHELLVNGEPVILHRREREVLEYLMINQAVWSARNRSRPLSSLTTLSPTVPSTYVSRLRKKLGTHAALKTVRGLGYLLDG